MQSSIKMEKLKTNFKFIDKRGIFIEVWRSKQWKQMNYFFCKKGQVRGCHYHKKTKELFFVVDGICEVSIINVKTHKKKKFLAKAQDMFTIEPYETHFLKAKSDYRIVAFLDTFYNSKKPDIYE